MYLKFGLRRDGSDGRQKPMIASKTMVENTSEVSNLATLVAGAKAAGPPTL